MIAYLLSRIGQMLLTLIVMSVLVFVGFIWWAIRWICCWARRRRPPKGWR